MVGMWLRRGLEGPDGDRADHPAAAGVSGFQHPKLGWLVMQPTAGMCGRVSGSFHPQVVVKDTEQAKQSRDVNLLETSSSHAARPLSA